MTDSQVKAGSIKGLKAKERRFLLNVVLIRKMLIKIFVLEILRHIHTLHLIN